MYHRCVPVETRFEDERDPDICYDWSVPASGKRKNETGPMLAILLKNTNIVTFFFFSSSIYIPAMQISPSSLALASLASSSGAAALASDANKMLRANVHVDLPEAEMRSLIASKAKSVEKLSTALQLLKERHDSNRKLQGGAVPELYEGDGDGFGFDFADADLGDLAGSFDLCGKDNDLEFMGTTCSCSLKSAKKEYSGLMDIIGDFSHVMENGRK